MNEDEDIVPDRRVGFGLGLMIFVLPPFALCTIGKKYPLKTRILSFLWILAFFFVIVPVFFDTEEMKKARQTQHLEELKAENERLALAQAADHIEAQFEETKKKKGLHCLGKWDGSIKSLSLAVRDSIREPASFEHIRTGIWPAKKGMHKAEMVFRARNRLGGTDIVTVIARINTEDCSVIAIDSVEAR